MGFFFFTFKTGKSSKKGENPGDDDLYEMVLRSQVSIEFQFLEK